MLKYPNVSVLDTYLRGYFNNIAFQFLYLLSLNWAYFSEVKKILGR